MLLKQVQFDPKDNVIDWLGHGKQESEGPIILVKFRGQTHVVVPGKKSIIFGQTHCAKPIDPALEMVFPGHGLQPGSPVVNPTLLLKAPDPVSDM